MEAEPDEVELGGCGRGDACAVVGVVGGLEQWLSIDREAHTAVDRAAMGAIEFDARRTVDEDRLADHRRVEPAHRLAVGVAGDLRVNAREAAGKGGCYLPNPPRPPSRPGDQARPL